MLNNLIFCLNATMPIFLMMVVGYFLKKIKLLDAHSTNVLNKAVFRVFIPCLLFMDLAKQDFVAMWDSSFVFFCMIATLVSIAVAFLFSKLDKDKEDRGEFIQAAYRSAAASLGIAFMTNIYDSTAMVALMILASVPIYNIAAVIILTVSLQDDGEKATHSKKGLVKKTAVSIVTNPIIIGVATGLAWSLLKLPLPTILNKSVTYLGNVASPLALIGLGASFEFSELKAKLKPVIGISCIKLLLFCALFLPLAVWMGFRDEKLVAALIMLGSATTSSCFIMARNMGHKGIISSGAVMTTTLFSSFTLTLWLFILRTLGYI